MVLRTALFVVKTIHSDFNDVPTLFISIEKTAFIAAFKIRLQIIVVLADGYTLARKNSSSASEVRDEKECYSLSMCRRSSRASSGIIIPRTASKRGVTMLSSIVNLFSEYMPERQHRSVSTKHHAPNN